MIDLTSLIEQCVPSIAQPSMVAIVKVESKGHPLALNLNKGYRLQFQPQSKAQAQRWVEYLEKHGYNFDIGLAQINIKNANKYGYNALDLLEPCTNLKLGSTILMNGYTSALPSSKSTSEAWQKSISAYNTGNFYSGFTNGYVGKVYASTDKTLLALNNSTSDIPPIIDSRSGQSNKNRSQANNNSAVSNTTNAPPSPYSSRSLLYIQPRKPTAREINSIKVSSDALNT